MYSRLENHHSWLQIPIRDRQTNECSALLSCCRFVSCCRFNSLIHWLTQSRADWQPCLFIAPPEFYRLPDRYSRGCNACFNICSLSGAARNWLCSVMNMLQRLQGLRQVPFVINSVCSIETAAIHRKPNEGRIGVFTFRNMNAPTGSVFKLGSIKS